MRTLYVFSHELWGLMNLIQSVIKVYQQCVDLDISHCGCYCRKSLDLTFLIIASPTAARDKPDGQMIRAFGMGRRCSVSRSEQDVIGANSTVLVQRYRENAVPEWTSGSQHEPLAK